MILVDLNVLLDVIQRREPHYAVSAAVLDKVIEKGAIGEAGDVAAAIPAHAVTTLHYIIERYNDRRTAREAITWLLRRFAITAVGRSELARAMDLGLRDFEDAVVAAAAEAAGCTAIVTRNVRDFEGSPVRALTPGEYLVSSE